MAIRVVIWPIRAVPVWLDLAKLLAAGKARNETVAYGFIAISSILSFMQVIWGYKVGSIALYNIKILLGSPKRQSSNPKRTKGA